MLDLLSSLVHALNFHTSTPHNVNDDKNTIVDEWMIATMTRLWPNSTRRVESLHGDYWLWIWQVFLEGLQVEIRHGYIGMTRKFSLESGLPISKDHGSLERPNGKLFSNQCPIVVLMEPLAQRRISRIKGAWHLSNNKYIMKKRNISACAFHVSVLEMCGIRIVVTIAEVLDHDSTDPRHGRVNVKIRRDCQLEVGFAIPSDLVFLKSFERRHWRAGRSLEESSILKCSATGLTGLFSMLFRLLRPFLM